MEYEQAQTIAQALCLVAVCAINAGFLTLATTVIFHPLFDVSEHDKWLK